MVSFGVFLLLAFASPYVLGQGRFGVAGPWFQLSYRLEKLGADIDLDNNGFITNEERVADLEQNYDADSDGCVTKEEFDAHVGELGFTEDVAQYFFDLSSAVGGAELNCSGILIEAVKNTLDARPLSVDEFLDEIVQSLIEMCEDRHILYATNLDCSSLPYACRAPPFACTRSCQIYTFDTTAERGPPFGALGQSDFYDLAWKLNELLQAADVDRDGNITSSETQADFETNFDRNNDSCVDEVEFKARMGLRVCDGLAFTEGFADRMFNILKEQAASSTCDGIDLSTAFDEQLTAEDFTNQTLGLLVEMCEEDQVNYGINSDCQSLPRTCRSAEFSALPVCQLYQETVEDRRGVPFQDPQNIFLDILRSISNGSFLGELIDLN